MFDAYADIFERRGEQYHQAMLEQPRARDREFEEIAGFARLGAGQLVCDAPSGGGYLGRHAPAGLRLVSLETSRVFARLAREGGAPRPLRAELERLPFAEGRLDRVVSAAALHHVEDKHAFHLAAARALRPGGALCVADVHDASPVCDFLETFVDENSEMGHSGRYVDEHYPEQLEAAELRVEAAERIAFPWRFGSEKEMCRFAQLLFGIDRATLEQVREGIERHLGWQRTRGGCELDWELAFFRAVKP